MSPNVARSSEWVADALENYAAELRAGAEIHRERVIRLLEVCALRIRDTGKYISLLERAE